MKRKYKANNNKNIHLKLLILYVFLFSCACLAAYDFKRELKSDFIFYLIIITMVTVFTFLYRHCLKVSDTKELTEKLHVKENLITVSKDILSIWSANWSLLETNSAFERILDYNRDELIKKNFIELIDPEERDKFIAQRNHLKFHKNVTFEIKMLTNTGQIRWISWYCFLDEESMSIYGAGRDITNENLFLEQLQQSEEKARKQFKSIPVPTYTWKRQGDDYILTDYNDIVFSITDGKVKEILGIRASELLKENYQVLRDMDFCYISRKPIKKEIEYFVEETHEKKYYITSYAFVPPDSVMIHMEDTTFKKSMEMELRDNEQKYKALFNSSSDAILLTDLTGKIIDCNQACTTLFNYTPEEMIDKPIYEMFYLENEKTAQKSIVTEIEELILNLFGLEVVDGFVEVVCIKKNGTPFSAETQAQFFTLKDHRMVLIFVRDLRDRKKMEQALKEREARLTAAFDNLPLDFWITDTQYVFLKQSNVSLGLWGDLNGQTINESNLPIEVKNQWTEVCEKAIKGEVIIREVTYTTENINKSFYQIIAPINTDNTVAGLLGVNLDMTENKQREEELKRYSTDLEKVNQELKSFAYIVSHDLKAPLRAITTLVDWLTTDYKDAFDSEGKNMLNLLTNRTKRMHDLIDGILKYSRVGRMDVPLENVYFYEMIQSVVNMLVVPENIDVIIDPNLPILKTPKIYMEQVFQNLISNAIKFMDKENGEIEISYHSLEDCYEFFVRDNGPGIDPKYHDKVFQIFQTLQPRDQFESTGIGLSIVKKIIENYGGTVRIESEVNVGTTFFFTIPK